MTSQWVQWVFANFGDSYPTFSLHQRSDMAFAPGETDLFQAVTMLISVLHGVNVSIPGVTCLNAE